MSDQTNDRARTPWHLWVVGGLNALWTAFGCFDYVMTNTQDDNYLRGMGMNDAQIAVYNAMPPWMTAAWAIGVFGGLLGSLLLLGRRRWAVWLLAVSLIGAIGSQLPTLFDTQAQAAFGSSIYLSVGVMAVAALVAAYAWAMSKRGVLR